MAATARSPAGGERPRLGKARKRARLAIKQTRKLLGKHGHKIDPAHRAEVETALEALQAADRAREVVAIYDALKALDARVEARMGFLRKSPAREYAESIGMAILIALLLRAFIVEAFTIPSGSMIPTLAVGDFLFVNKLSYGIRLPWVDKMLVQWGQPEQGDVVVFVYPCNKSQDFIKRVVALPGQVVDVTDPHGFVTVDGKLVGEIPTGAFDIYEAFDGGERGGGACIPGPLNRYKVALGGHIFETLHCSDIPPEAQASGNHVRPPETWADIADLRWCKGENSIPANRKIPMPWKVPEGHVFVMGDNRDNSADSRSWGFVPMGYIKGKAMFIWLSWDGSKPFSRFWEKIRWNRLGRGVHTVPE